MESSNSDQPDVLDIYRRFCEIKSCNACDWNEVGCEPDYENQKGSHSREALAQLSCFVDPRVNRVSVFSELSKLMSRLNLGEFSEFSNFYDFVFFMCRESGQKNITVNRAVSAWKLVLPGRFRLLNQWCDFVERNQRYNISEDTWREVLAFSRCVREDLQGYDLGGAWPTLIDDFVEHMYRITGSSDRACNNFCNCNDSDVLPLVSDDSLPGLKSYPGTKRRSDGFERNAFEISALGTPEVQNFIFPAKRRKLPEKPLGIIAGGLEDGKNSTSPLCSSKSPCYIEGCLSKGFAGLFSSHSYVNFDQERRDTHKMALMTIGTEYY